MKTTTICTGACAAVFLAASSVTKHRQADARASGRHVPYGPYEAVFKRPLDAALAAFTLTALLPVMAVAAGLCLWKQGRPVLFCQRRPGLDEKPFTMYKFRTMTEQTDSAGRPAPDETRLTDYGRLLRASSLDELPELFNILKGDMSFVGPRPLLMEYLPLYDSTQRRRHEVRPGLTGLAQVSGRNLLSWQRKFMLDLEYAGHVTLVSDLAILFRTVAAVLGREGIGTDSGSTSEAFTGNVPAGEPLSGTESGPVTANSDRFVKICDRQGGNAG